ncbi:dephospho-CoA kinase [Allorhodopirellula heiligendammensis]|uniref:Dephospho-CoA kinase n=1 Tax=Allorhodopirellula heiligendammensis TaxID=2714739 RepID=A0A5C6C0V3_9BACT|nr:dephospho-CoA kinase [Allorhodopirellula heiligendammensis]TWU18180.1 Dephospho-CoA kinase [Allorhodopirellula heiligendammensis]
MTERNTTLVIGIIGPPCSGKSTVARVVESRGGVWIDADAIAKEQLSDAEVIADLVESFGIAILASDGSVSRAQIADLVFGDDDESHRRLKKLESIIHPRTHRIIQSRLDTATARGALYIILDVPLLLESGWESQCDQIWCMQIEPARHRQLLAARGWSETELARREQRQLPWAEKRRRSTWVIQNDGSVDDLREKVVRMLNQSRPAPTTHRS